MMLSMLLPSNTDSMLEFFTFTGRSFLIQIIQNDIQTVLKNCRINKEDEKIEFNDENIKDNEAKNIENKFMEIFNRLKS